MSSSATAKVDAPIETPQQQHRRNDVQGLRAIAVLAVIASHAGLALPGGFAGVDVFFVISGYVITAMLVREIATHGRIRYARFYIRRFKRLTPALALMLTVTMLVAAAVLGPLGIQEEIAQTGLGAVFLVANFVIAVAPGDYTGTNPLIHTWSLSVEEQFYLFFPALLGIAWVGLHRAKARRGAGADNAGNDGTGARRLRPRRAFVAVAAVGAVSFVWAMIGSTGVGLPGPDVLVGGFYSPIGRAWEFAVGALIALAPVPRMLSHRTTATVVGIIGLVALAVSFLVVHNSTPWPGPVTLLPVLGTAAAIMAGSDPKGAANPVTRLLSMRPAVAVGDWSYSLYLWHWPVIVTVVTLWPHSTVAPLAGAFLCAVPALLSYRFVEEPIRHDSGIVGRKLAAAVVLTITPPILTAALLWAGDSQGWW